MQNTEQVEALVITCGFDKYKDFGLTGLANVGNTCYLNSCLQILSHTYELNDFLQDKKYQKNINRKPDSVLLLEWDNLRELMWSDNCTIAPNGFIEAVKKVSTLKDRSLFAGHEQNDIQEFLLFLVECFHNALARDVNMQITGKVINKRDVIAKACYEMMKTMYNTEYSEILKIFYGIHVSEISSCETGESLSLRPEPFSVLSLPIPQDNDSPTLLDCIDLYCVKEELSGENAWMNDKTNKKEDVKRGIIFWDLPKILIIDLKRWTDSGNKIMKAVEAPLTNADFSKHVCGYNKASNIYDLYGVCNHSGGTLGGHYKASVKNANGKWYEFNDTSVSEIDESQVVSQTSYCFFYRKKE
tara:strand:+ start:20 stop:1090 length:1071 start_codon:yes stop_codon:yes gene_type:complete